MNLSSSKSHIVTTNIFDVISSGPNDKLERLTSIHSNVRDDDKKLVEKCSILKSDAYAGLFQFFEEYEYNADEQRELEILEEKEKALRRRRRHSLLDDMSSNIYAPNSNRRKSVAALHASISEPKDSKEKTKIWSNEETEFKTMLQKKSVGHNNNERAFLDEALNDKHELNVFSDSLSNEARCASPPIATYNQDSPQVEVKNYSAFSSRRSLVENSVKWSSNFGSLEFKSKRSYQERRKSCFVELSSITTDVSKLPSLEKNKALRCASITVGALEELKNSIISASRISPIKEDINNESMKAGDVLQHLYLENDSEDWNIIGKSHRTKQRSHSLCPKSAELASEKILNSRNIASRPCNHLQRRSSSSKLRSDSIDSGFSCSSISSCSSSGSSTPLNEKCRTRSASAVVAMQQRYHSDTNDFPIWLKSVKKLVNLTKEMKIASENKDATELSHQTDVDAENVKKFIRHNDWPVSHEIRADLWRLLCHNKDFDSNKLLYVSQLEDLTKSGVKTFRPLFLSMDGMVVDDHGLRQEGAVTLQRLLIVIECVRPEIRYVPILYPLCAMFLHYISAEETFACVIRLLSQGHTFVLQSELAVYASCHTLLSLLKKHKKSVYTMLKRRAGTSDDLKLAEVFLHWNAWIFKHMPFEYLVRVMDCFFVEGHKMLLRVALSLVYIWYKNRSRSFANWSNTSVSNGPLSNNNTRNFTVLKLGAREKSTAKLLPSGDAAKPSSSTTSSVEQNIAEINDQIVKIAQNCPISVQTLLDMCWAIRNFKHSSFEQRQKHYENKFREQVARIRSEKSSGKPLRSVYTAAFESKIIDTEAASELMAALPSRFQLETPQLIFRLSEHGASFVQLWSQIDEAEQSLLLIRSAIGEVFGAYCSSCWNERRDVRERAKTRYFGTGESFVWRLDPIIHLPVIFQWSGQNSEHPDSSPQMFMTAGDRFLIIGSGGCGDAIAIRDELSQGLSYSCDTFDSPSLLSNGNNSFEIDELEVFQVVGTGGARALPCVEHDELFSISSMIADEYLR